MESKYLKYSLEELLEEKHFIAWVLRGEQNEEWKKFIDNNPEFSNKSTKAREIIMLLRDTYEILDEESVLEMWQNIDRFEQLHKQKVRRINFRKTISWAASLLLVVSLGTLGYFYINEKESVYQFSASESITKNDEARLVLSGGDEIALTEKNSILALNNDNQLTINNSSTIDLTQSDSKKESQMNEVVIPYGKKSELLLADGTKVWLNAGSRLAFPTKFTKKTREVYLEGEAYFEVTKNEAQPFIVNVEQINIRVLGTHFNVSAYPTNESVETVLLEGSVALSNETKFGLTNNEKILKPNQKAQFNKADKILTVVDEPDAISYKAWTEGWLPFHRESLQSVFAKLERYYNVDIKTPENFPAAELITGKLDLKESLNDVLLALSDVANIDFRIADDKIYIDKRIKELHMK
jgi:hypothetical protein